MEMPLRLQYQWRKVSAMTLKGKKLNRSVRPHNKMLTIKARLANWIHASCHASSPSQRSLGYRVSTELNPDLMMTRAL